MGQPREAFILFYALFQYDPDADGAGTRGWRLLYEGREWRGFLT